jgi:hypothetical protein
MEHPKGALLWYSPALFSDTRLGWKGLPGTNTPAYYKYLVNYRRKKFKNIWPWKYGLSGKGLTRAKTQAYFDNLAGFSGMAQHLRLISRAYPNKLLQSLLCRLWALLTNIRPV